MMSVFNKFVEYQIPVALPAGVSQCETNLKLRAFCIFAEESGFKSWL